MDKDNNKRNDSSLFINEDISSSNATEQEAPKKRKKIMLKPKDEQKNIIDSLNAKSQNIPNISESNQNEDIKDTLLDGISNGQSEDKKNEIKKEPKKKFFHKNKPNLKNKDNNQNELKFDNSIQIDSEVKLDLDNKIPEKLENQDKNINPELSKNVCACNNCGNNNAVDTGTQFKNGDLLENNLLSENNEINEEVKVEESKPLPPPETIEFNDLKHKKPEELVVIAEKYNVQNIAEMNKQDMVYGILKSFSNINPLNIIIGEGVLEVLSDGFGFMRSQFSNYVAGPDDIYVSPNQIKRFGLRSGDLIKGEVKAPKKGEKYFSLVRIISVNFLDPAHLRNRLRFDDLTPLYPDEKLQIEDFDAVIRGDDSSRIIDMITPMGKGQRALIVAPPRTGKTVLMQNIAHAITKAHPEAYLIVLLIDERPEEVTDMARSVKGEVVSSTFDEPAFRHVQLAEMVIEKAKRLVEYKKDVVILLDSITRLARAYNNVIPSSGKVLTGGVDANALQKPKRFFGAARNIEEGGSLTIIATALIETGSKMDEVIFEEFKGTGNSEIILDRKLSDKRIFPAMDITKSGTRKEDLLIDKATLSKTWMLRKILTSMNSVEAMEFLKSKMKNTKNNAEFFDVMNS